jgi:hypothetical protein
LNNNDNNDRSVRTVSLRTDLDRCQYHSDHSLSRDVFSAFISLRSGWDAAHHLFKIPRELRHQIYEHVFTAATTHIPSSQIAVPLLACRQVYVEARAIAFSTIDCHVDWEEVMGKYYDGPSPDLEPTAWRRTSLCSPSSRDPHDFTMDTICTRARLTQQHRASLRRITIARYQKRELFIPQDSVFYHLYQDLDQVLTKDFQLDSLTLDYIPHPQRLLINLGRFIDTQFQPNHALL